MHGWIVVDARASSAAERLRIIGGMHDAPRSPARHAAPRRCAGTPFAAFTLLLAALPLSGPVLAADAPAAAQPPVDRYLKALVGPWTMRGTLMGQPVQYRAEGRWVLDNGFLQLDMVDVAEPPQYRASVFIGFDREHTDYVAHWLDNSGASGARVVGTGRLEGRTLTLRFPYADGAFREGPHRARLF